MRYKDIKENMNYDVTDDRAHIMNLDDTRKPRLTLRHLNKLRQMRASKKLDMLQREKLWSEIYGNKQEQEPDLGF